MGHAIEVHALAKSFGPSTALEGLDLVVRTGEVHAFRGAVVVIGLSARRSSCPGGSSTSRPSRTRPGCPAVR